MSRTAKGHYTYRIDNRTYIIRINLRPSPLPASGLATLYGEKHWTGGYQTQTTYIAAGGGRVAKGARRIV